MIHRLCGIKIWNDDWDEISLIVGTILVILLIYLGVKIG
jgi:hypothetical protein